VLGAVVADDIFMGGSRPLDQERLPIGNECVGMGRAVEVEFHDAIYFGSVVKRYRNGSFAVLFRSDGETVTIEPDKHRYCPVNIA
jgi:hypothetical protein